MKFTEFVNCDVTMHTSTHKYRGILVEILKDVLIFEVGIDAFYLQASQVIGVTVHGRSTEG